jgi:hypothetical protein
MGQSKGEPHQRRRDPERLVIREPLPMARHETTLAAIEAVSEALTDPKLGNQRRHNLELLAELKARARATRKPT